MVSTQFVINIIVGGVDQMFVGFVDNAKSCSKMCHLDFTSVLYFVGLLEKAAIILVHIGDFL